MIKKKKLYRVYDYGELWINKNNSANCYNPL